MAGPWKPKYGFALPSLAKSTFVLLQEMVNKTNRTQWELVTIALHLLYSVIKQRKDNPALKELLNKIVIETKDLKPNNGQFIDREHNRQTDEENGNL